jgi:hypothetical protein
VGEAKMLWSRQTLGGATDTDTDDVNDDDDDDDDAEASLRLCMRHISANLRTLAPTVLPGAAVARPLELGLAHRHEPITDGRTCSPRRALVHRGEGVHMTGPEAEAEPGRGEDHLVVALKRQAMAEAG